MKLRKRQTKNGTVVVITLLLLLLLSISVLQLGLADFLTTLSPITSTETAALLLTTAKEQAPRTSKTPKTSLQRCPAGIPSTRGPSLFQSQSKEDKELLRLFNGTTTVTTQSSALCKGTYLEMGALDGIRFSNSYLFHHGFNWKGVLIEASPKNYKLLVANRPQEIATLHSGVCGNEATTLHWVEGRTDAVGGFQEFAGKSFQQFWWPKEKIRNAEAVKCQPLRTVLDEATRNNTTPGGSFHFDFFSLDVEGAEYEVLRSNDWGRFTFGIVFVEADWYNKSKNDDVRNLLETNGYKFLRNYQRSQWFAHENWDGIYQDVLR